MRIARQFIAGYMERNMSPDDTYPYRHFISSDDTYPNKNFFLIISLMGLAGIITEVIMGSMAPLNALEGCLFMSYICFRLAWCPKIVSVSGKFLYISDRRKEIQIPLSHIARVRQTFFMRWKPEHVVIKLSHPSEFGKKIIFFPEGIAHDIFETHPIVDRLNRLIHSHKQKMRQNNSKNTGQ